jgi:hypothetical protein
MSETESGAAAPQMSVEQLLALPASQSGDFIRAFCDALLQAAGAVAQTSRDEPLAYTAGEAAAILKCTASWLKEQARRRRIPFTRIGGGYRWTPAHLEEIVRLGEHKPEPLLAPRAAVRRAPAAPAGAPEVVLRGRIPPRMRRLLEQPPQELRATAAST